MKYFLFIIMIIPSLLPAAVWKDSNLWSLEHEEAFSAWMISANVHETMFTDKNSKYHGINTDCADTSYALRAIFSFENSLPFAIKEPSGSRTSTTFNNRSSKWDRLPTPEKRLVAMINEIGESVGTENLSMFDSYPLAIEAITPGSLYMYKIKRQNGMHIRHSYNIKAINDVGTFDTIYSTQANKMQKNPLIRKKNYEFSYLPNAPWGFKRIRWPEHVGQSLDQIPVELGVSNEQYAMAKQLGEKAFFKSVKKQLATSSETANERIERLFNLLCKEVNTRITYVNEAAVELKKSNGQCMDYEKFDAYSTPARDRAIREIFEKLEDAFREAKEDGPVAKDQPYLLTQSLFSTKAERMDELLNACPINYRENMTISLATYRARMIAEKVSSHPNDSIEARWGESAARKTKCKAWY